MVDLHEEFAKSRLFHRDRIDRRAADELTGIAAGITADGVVSQEEAFFLRSWITNNLAHLDDPVINILYQRLSSMLADGKLDNDESVELMGMLRCFTGEGPAKNHQTIHNTFTHTNALPLCHPAPDIEFNGRLFVFTGVMAYGPRKDCQALVEERQGIIAGGISKKIHYLVIGSIGNEQWLHSTYGTKIKKAVELRESGAPLAIVSEDAWQNALFHRGQHA